MLVWFIMPARVKCCLLSNHLFFFFFFFFYFSEGNAAGFMNNKAFLLEVVLNHFADRDSQIQQVNELPLYPNETLLWDENLVPLGQYYGGKVLALPKLNLQFLTPHDYLLR